MQSRWRCTLSSAVLACWLAVAGAKLRDPQEEMPAEPAADTRYVLLMDRPDSGRRILGGKRADRESHPYALVLLGPDGRVRCSGAAVGPQHVLTAAHCTRAPLAFASRTASHRTRDLMPVHAAYPHPDFSMLSEGKAGKETVTQLHNDVAIVVVYNEFKPPIRVIPLGDAVEEYLEYEVASTVGYGKVTETEGATQLMQTEVVLRRCPLANWTVTMCGFTPWDSALAAACAGDSGAPLAYEGVVVGVASLGPATCGPRAEDAVVGAFTLVAPVRAWLERARRTPLSAHEDERAVRHINQVFQVMAADSDRFAPHFTYLPIVYFMAMVIYVGL